MPDAAPDEQTEAQRKKARKWLDAIARAEKDGRSYYERARTISKLYAEQRKDAVAKDQQYAMLWANTEVLRPAVYARQPMPVVKRRFNDRDPAGRAVSDVIERCVITLFDVSGVDETMKAARDDFLIVGRGTAWVRYEAAFAPAPPTEGGEGDDEYGAEPAEGEEPQAPDGPTGPGVQEDPGTLSDETVKFDFVHWSDFIHPKCRRWEDLPWAGRRVHMDDDKLDARFGKDKAKEVRDRSIAYAAEKGGSLPDKDAREHCVYEVWSRTDRKVYWLAKDCDIILDEQPPLYDLSGFFPCPRPAFATLPTDSLTPIPDYIYYQDQAEEVNRLTQRIAALTDALKMVGFYPDGGESGISAALEQAFAPGNENKMIPVPGWAAFTQGGGSSQLVQYLPIDMVVKTIQSCIELRRQLIEDVYQITGISDILRGMGKASETATAQNIKAQWGGIRIRERQQEMARFARDIVRITGEIVAEQFQPETIFRLCGLNYPTQAEKQQVQAQLAMQQQQAAMMAAQQGQEAPQPPQVPPELRKILDAPSQEEVIALMRDDHLRSYRVDIETDSTVAADEQAEKDARNEFLAAVGGFMQSAVPLGQAIPQFVPAIGEMLMFVVRGYRAGRQLEDVIEQSVQELTEAAANPPPPPEPQPDPKLVADQEKLAWEKEKFGLERQDKALPEAGMIMQAAGEVGQMVPALAQMVGGLQQSIGAIGQGMQQITAQQSAPVEAVRGPNGEIIAVRKGDVVRQVVRDDMGRAAALM